MLIQIPGLGINLKSQALEWMCTYTHTRAHTHTLEKQKNVTFENEKSKTYVTSDYSNFKTRALEWAPAANKAPKRAGNLQTIHLPPKCAAKPRPPSHERATCRWKEAMRRVLHKSIRPLSLRHSWYVCCSVLQCIAACCSVLQCVAACCSVLQRVAVCCSVLQCVAVCCSVLHCVVVCCIVLQCRAVCCSVLQCLWPWRLRRSWYVRMCVAVCCSVLQCVTECCSAFGP